MQTTKKCLRCCEQSNAPSFYDHIEAYATAYPAARGEIRWLSALHHAPERRIEGITIEAHSREEHLRAHCEILSDRFGPLSPIEPAPPTSPMRDRGLPEHIYTRAEFAKKR